MCLQTVSKTKPKPEGMGYKVFYKNPNRGIETANQFFPVTLGKWLHAFKRGVLYTQVSVSSLKKYPYPKGFHVFASKEGAIAWVVDFGYQIVLPVKYRKAHTQGTQEGRKVIVADEIFVEYQRELKELK